MGFCIAGCVVDSVASRHMGGGLTSQCEGMNAATLIKSKKSRPARTDKARRLLSPLACRYSSTTPGGSRTEAGGHFEFQIPTFKSLTVSL